MTLAPRGGGRVGGFSTVEAGATSCGCGGGVSHTLIHRWGKGAHMLEIMPAALW